VVAPVFNALDDTPAYTENASAVVLDADATIVDPDAGAFDGATLTLARSGGANPDDILADSGGFLNENQVIVAEVVIGTYSNADGTLTITFNSDADAPSVNQVLQALTYANASDAPPASVTIGYTFDNGEQATGSIMVGITAANDAPTVDGLTAASFYQPGSSGVVLSPGIVLADDGATLSGATVNIEAGLDADDLLSANTGSTGITANYDSITGELTLTGVATVEQYRQVLATVAYASSDANAAAGGQRAILWSVTDGALGSGTTSTLVDFIPTVDLDQSGAGLDFSTSFTEGGTEVAIADSDAFMTTSSAISSIRVVLTNAKPGDTLAVNGGSLDVDVDNSVAGQITLTISAAGISVPSDATLRSISFGNANANVDPTARNITVVVSDGNNASVAAHSTVTIAGAVNDPGVAHDDTAATAGNTTLSVTAAQGVLANDNDPDGLAVITGAVATSQGGSIHFAADGSYVYTPAAFFFGTDTVGYTAQDPFGSQVSATLHIDVGAASGTAGDDSYAAPSGNSAIDAGLGNDAIRFDFRLVDATVTWSGNHVTIDGPSSHTVLSGFERYQFTDGTVDNNDGNPLVDDLFYYAANHDVWNAGADADQHYASFGWHEGRDPSAFFSTSIYLSANADVRAANVNPLVHFDQVGWQEGRVPSLAFDPQQYLDAYPNVAAAHIDPLADFLQNGYQENRLPFAPTELIATNGFDYVYYLGHNPDVAAAHVDPLAHFQTIGWQEGRNPNALFDIAGYLATYADVAAAHVNPFEHYNQFGWHEGRDPSVGFDTTAYLAAYPDVAAAGVNPLVHFLQFGQHEGRAPFADGVWG
jgi:hypothetical protein